MMDTSTFPVETLKTHLRGDLAAAMKRRDKAETALLRQLVAALDNAEAVPAREESASLVRHVFGTGTSEAERRHLTEDDIRALLKWEMDDRTKAAAEFARLGVESRAAALTAEVELIRRYVGGEARRG
ncbi:GatB/YqeY domain-containing protein [Pleomorphomonas sp. NRK KF1]|uniref:GatB/YqeY domain-containing protein n=1 Tax=Pleomorphomonas sp. NRK KF1 TaxID=2943000 RepID=UPI002044AFAB|nr:GatB/YqeY domain-containing protein [Pleomorphomonas sp. NRK KF1]MCM5554157.1 GatB/YqeY domain-containing protein [Pleomorphomonas sp. NRK KF1]